LTTNSQLAVKMETLELAPLEVQTETGEADPVDLVGYEEDEETAEVTITGGWEGQVLIGLAAAGSPGGTSPTLDVKLQHCATKAGVYADVPEGAFDQVTDTGGFQGGVFDLAILKRWLKVVWTIGGTKDEGDVDPSFAFGVQLVGLKKYS
jgi:hypothetical protein